MERRTRRVSPTVIDPARFGVSFSLKQCRNFGIDPHEALEWLIDEAGFRRFRLMSYWDEHERTPGSYDFAELDWQIAQAEKSNAIVTLCLGARQPRWPENHWLTWAWELPKAGRDKALLEYIETVVKRYRGKKIIVSYQLENEALLKTFGERPEIDRTRLQAEFALVKQLDPKTPIIMTTSTSWGIPVRRPIPDIVGISFYHTLFSHGAYHRSFHFPSFDRGRALATRLFHGRPFFVHELQLEPWGPANIWEMSSDEQDKSMSAQQIAQNLTLAKRIKHYPIDLWGGEWWYWRLTKHNDPTTWEAVKKALTP